MSGQHKSHGSKHRDLGGDGDRDRDRDSSRHHHHSNRDRGESRGRDGSRDGRDRDHKSKHGNSSSRDGPSSQTTPPKLPAAAAAKPPARGPVLGSSFLSSSVLEAAKAEAAKRKAAEAAAAAAAGAAADGGSEPGEVVGGGARKRPRHEPIVWHSPPKQGGDQAQADDRPSSRQETLQERLQREAAEFRQQQHQHDGAAARPSSRQQRPGSRGRARSSSSSGGSRSRSRSRGRGRSSSSDRGGGSSRSRSSSREGGGNRRRPMWQQEDDDEDEQQQKQQKQPGKSRWNLDDEAGDGGDAEVEEGEAVGDGVGAAIDEELEELNRRERAALAAGDGGVLDSAAVADLFAGGTAGAPHSTDATSDASERMRAEGLDLQHNMLDESRKVEEYEKLNRISEGTYGIVFRARCKSSGKIYALKKLKMEACPDGFPQTSVREVNVLLSLHHPNIVNVTEVCVGGRDGIFMVMEYVEHDLKYVMELQKAKKAQQFSIGQIKCLMKQLLEGVAFLHASWVIHRDLKTSNLLYSNTGQLKICDFGLARQYGDPLSPYTPMVVTLWYRAIERLLGDPKYSTALDMWSVGCIMGELLLGEPLFQGKGELDQIKKIFALLGTPTQESWPGWDQLQDSKHLQWKPAESQLRSKFPTVFFGGAAPVLSDAGFDLLSQMLEMNPERRISAEKALKHKWFTEAPRPVTPALMPSFQARHQQGGSNADYRDKLHRPSPGAVGPAGFKI